MKIGLIGLGLKSLNIVGRSPPGPAMPSEPANAAALHVEILP